MDFSIQDIRKDFPILEEKVYGKNLVYFDNAATTQKPWQVINKISDYYKHSNSNIHRGVHFLSQNATLEYESTRENVRDFINAKHTHEIIFTRGTTESINLVASSFGKKFLSEGDEVLISSHEHHSNIVPWQMVCESKKASLRVIPIDENGALQIEKIDELFSSNTKLVALTHISNALGIVNPVREIIKKAHNKNIPVLIDGAQSVPHEQIDVVDLDCDFFCFSSHKMYGPMGVGVLYAKEKYLSVMPPYQGGGEMISQVTFEKSTYNELPFKFEAGTPNVADVIGFNEAIDYLRNIGFDAIKAYEDGLYQYATERILSVEGVKIIGNSPHKVGVISFLIGNIHPYDAGTIIDKFGIAVRTGHHCAQPVIDHFGLSGTIRASFGLYNTREEVDKLVDVIGEVKKMFGE